MMMTKTSCQHQASPSGAFPVQVEPSEGTIALLLLEEPYGGFAVYLLLT